MLLFKKIVAAILMALSVIAVVALIAGLFGSWVVRARLETATIEFLLAGENAIRASQEVIVRVDGILETSTAVVDEVDTTIRGIGTNIQESDPVFGRLLDAAGIDLRSRIESAVQQFTMIEANIIAVNEAIDAFTSIPMLGMQNRLPDVTLLNQVENQMARLREDVTLLVRAIESGRAAIIDGKIGSVTDITGGLRDNLISTRTSLNDAGARLTETSASMAALRARIPGLYLTITILLNLLFLLSIIAFVSLFLHAWQVFKCPQDGLGALMPRECAQPAAA